LEKIKDMLHMVVINTRRGGNHCAGERREKRDKLHWQIFCKITVFEKFSQQNASNNNRMRFIALLLLPLSVDSTDIDPIIQAYRDLISIDRFGEKPDTSDYATTALHLRDYMISNDVNYPSFHATAPEGWLNDPNGVSFDPVSKLYHRFCKCSQLCAKQGNKCRV